MRKVIYSMSVSLDGFIEASNGNFSWLYPDEELHQYFTDQEAMIDVHLYGRRLYENMVAYWPTVESNPSAPRVEIEYARIWKDMKKIVFSKTLKTVGWNSQLVGGNIAEVVNKLKSLPGKNMSIGGANLASAFIQLGLIDEYCFYVHPIILGSGKPMFLNLHDKINLKFIETRTFSSGVVLLKNETKSPP